MPKDNPRELLWLVDNRDKPIGPVNRSDAHSDSKLVHRSVCIIVHNRTNQILLQKRSCTKDTYPNHWTLSATGHVTFGQTYLQSAQREQLEELGISTKLELVAKFLLRLPFETEYCSIYKTLVDYPKLTLDNHEVFSVKWINISQLSSFSDQNRFTPDTLQILQHLQYL